MPGSQHAAAAGAKIAGGHPSRINGARRAGGQVSLSSSATVTLLKMWASLPVENKTMESGYASSAALSSRLDKMAGSRRSWPATSDQLRSNDGSVSNRLPRVTAALANDRNECDMRRAPGGKVRAST